MIETMVCHTWQQITFPSSPCWPFWTRAELRSLCPERTLLIHFAFSDPSHYLSFLGAICSLVEFYTHQTLQFAQFIRQSNFSSTVPTHRHDTRLISDCQVIDTRPVAARTDFSDLSAVDKYVMPTPEYENRTDSVLAWKKAQKLGRFDPNAPSIEQQKILASEREVDERGKNLFAV